MGCNSVRCRDVPERGEWLQPAARIAEGHSVDQSDEMLLSTSWRKGNQSSPGTTAPEGLEVFLAGPVCRDFFFFFPCAESVRGNVDHLENVQNPH